MTPGPIPSLERQMAFLRAGRHDQRARAQRPRAVRVDEVRARQRIADALDAPHARIEAARRCRRRQSRARSASPSARSGSARCRCRARRDTPARRRRRLRRPAPTRKPRACASIAAAAPAGPAPSTTTSKSSLSGAMSAMRASGVASVGACARRAPREPGRGSSRRGGRRSRARIAGTRPWRRTTSAPAVAPRRSLAVPMAHAGRPQGRGDALALVRRRSRDRRSENERGQRAATPANAQVNATARRKAVTTMSDVTTMAATPAARQRTGATSAPTTSSAASTFITPRARSRRGGRGARRPRFCLSLPLDRPGGNYHDLRPARAAPAAARAARPRQVQPACQSAITPTSTTTTRCCCTASSRRTGTRSRTSARCSMPTATACPRCATATAFAAASRSARRACGRRVGEGAFAGARALGIERLAETGLQGRGVLVDLRRAFGDARRAVGYDDLMRVARRAARRASRRGDILCLHTGQTDVLLAQGERPSARWLEDAFCHLDGCDDELLRWIDDVGHRGDRRGQLRGGSGAAGARDDGRGLRAPARAVPVQARACRSASSGSSPSSPAGCTRTGARASC